MAWCHETARNAVSESVVGVWTSRCLSNYTAQRNKRGFFENNASLCSRIYARFAPRKALSFSTSREGNPHNPDPADFSVLSELTVCGCSVKFLATFLPSEKHSTQQHQHLEEDSGYRRDTFVSQALHPLLSCVCVVHMVPHLPNNAGEKNDAHTLSGIGASRLYCTPLHFENVYACVCVRARACVCVFAIMHPS